MISRRPIPRGVVLFVPVLLAALTSPVRADTLHLKGGDKIEGEVVKDLGEALRFRTLSGVVDIEKERIVKHVKGPSPWRLYENQRKAAPDTAEGHYQLALWCRKHGLRAEEIEHLERVIRLDPEHADARQALGYVKQDGAWVKPPPPQAPTPEEREAQRAAREEERRLRKLVSNWFVKVRAIHRGRMEGEKEGSAKFRQGRERILAIRDPLALPALTGVLSTGNVAARRVLVEALAGFEQDEATMNFLVITLYDPSREIRGLAATDLLRRKDPRVVAELRDALQSNEEPILRHAAAALGVLKARAAVEDLIGVLTTERQGTIRISRPVYLDGVVIAFGGGCRYVQGRRLVYYRPIGIGVMGPGTIVGTATRYESVPVSVNRTEVQEALIAITGQNFGFDETAWQQWWRRQGQ
jgi:hypothetical protein